MFRRKNKKTRITDVDIERKESTLYFVREYKESGEDRTVAAFVSMCSAEDALRMIKKNKKLTRGKVYSIEEFNYVEHKNSLVGK